MNDLISRKAAIDAHERIFDRCEEIEVHLPEGDPDRVGYKMYPDWLTVWKYLCQSPSTQPERTEYVDLSERVTATFYDEEHEEWSQKTVTIRDVLDSVCDEYTILPSAEPEWKTGHWKNRSLNILYPEWERYECSACGGYSYNHKFCPNCGAKMEEPI